MYSVNLSKEDACKITVEHIATTLIVMKQYLDDEKIANYKFMLREFATWEELEDIKTRFDRAWPTDVQWWNE